MDEQEIRDIIKEELKYFFSNSEEYSFINVLHDKINRLISVKDQEEKVDSLIKYCDKFEDYMKNIDKLNQMINEFKGIVAIVRGESNYVQKENEKLKKKLRNILETLSE